MAIIRSIPSEKVIGGRIIKSSEIVIVSEPEYTSNGEGLIIVKDVPFCKLKLTHLATDHVRVKSLTNTLIIPDIGLFDEKYDELSINSESCVEFYFAQGNWYITSSDGLKLS
jgi:hypothetical protein